MQEAAVVLGVLRERGRKGLPFTQLYRQMFNKDLYLLAYGNIYSNQGAMTPGAGGETADGMSEDKIDQIIGLMRHERYRFAPARRIYIPKKNGKLRPLGLPSWPDKLVGEVVRLLLEAIYEPCFSGMVARVPERTRMPYRAPENPGNLDRDHMVHRGRYLRLLRQFQPRNPSRDTGGENPR